MNIPNQLTQAQLQQLLLNQQLNLQKFLNIMEKNYLNILEKLNLKLAKILII